MSGVLSLGILPVYASRFSSIVSVSSEEEVVKEGTHN
jgi:hypothetical protein